MKVRLRKAERETLLLTSEADDTWEIHTFNKKLINRLRKFSDEHPDLCWSKYESKNLCYVDYIVKKPALSFHLIATYSDERRKAASERAKQHGIQNNTQVSSKLS